MKTVGENIRRLRTERGWTQEELSKMTGIGEKYISSLEGGRRNPGPKVMKELCDAFTVSERAIKYGEFDQNGLDYRHSPVLKMIVETLSPLTETEQLEWLLTIRKAKEAQKQD